MQVCCPDCRRSMEAHNQEILSTLRCTACGSAFTLLGDETLDVRPDQRRACGRFELQKRLGAGSFGSVWRAYDATLGRTVAVKIPRAADLDPAEDERFLREARASAHLRHPHIIGVHEVGREGETLYIVMEYIHGTTLADRLAEGPLPPRDAARLCATIADAIHYAHEAGVIHRDLKPSNILLSQANEPYVTDFGLARRVSDEATLTCDGHILGTPAYMSPEQVRGDAPRIDGRTDVYSIGVILFESLTGKRPFQGNLRMLLKQVLEVDAPRPRDLQPSVPRDLETICLKCLEKNPRERYTTAAELAEDLRRYLAGQPVLARPTPRLARAQRWCRHNWLVTCLAGGLLVVLTAGLIGTATQWARAERNAANQAALQRQIAALTQELVQLASQIRAMETTRMENRTDEQRIAGDAMDPVHQDQASPLRFSPALPATSLEPPAPTAARSRSAPRSDTPGLIPMGTPHTVSAPPPLPRPAVASAASPEQAEAARLRARANQLLDRLNELAPDVARRYRELLTD